MSERPLPETSVPPGETAAVCSYCERPFGTARQRGLHIGEAHPDCDSEERDAYEAAREA